MKIALLWLALCCAPAGAEGPVPHSCLVLTDPPGLQVFRWNKEASRAADNDFLGLSGQTLTVSFDPIHGGDQVRLFFVPPPEKLDETRAYSVTLTLNDLAKGRYPLQGALPVPLTLGQRVALFRYQNGPWALPALTLGACGALVGAGLLLARGRRAAVPAAPSTRQIARYTLGARLGSGAMAEVYRAEAAGDPIPYAIKLLRMEVHEGDNQAKRFQREVQICVNSVHPNIVRVYDWGEYEGQLYLVLELLEGRTLRDALRQDPRPDPDWTLRQLRSLAQALHFLHERGIVHRDVKPDNIFLCGDGTLKLMDFGIARGADLTAATQTGMTMGTPAYMAPEQVQGKFEPASDQYALGVLAYRMLTGRLPFDDDDPIALAMQHLHKPPPEPTELPAHQRQALLRMLRKHPQQRYVDVLEAVEALELLGSEEESTVGFASSP